MMSQEEQAGAGGSNVVYLIGACATILLWTHLFVGKASATDLVMVDVRTQSIAYPGEDIGIFGNVTDQDSTTSGGYYVGYYLSTDTTITTADTFVGRRLADCCHQVPLKVSTHVTIPENLPERTYYIGAIADYDNEIGERDEANNSLVGNAIVVAKPDLIMTSVSLNAKKGETVTAVAGGGDKIAMSYSTANLGQETGIYPRVGLYLSTDNNITASDIFLDWKGPSGGPLEVAIPGSVAEGTYYFGGIVDYDNQIPETTETNNSLAGNTIVITKPDLIIAAIGAPAHPGNCLFTLTATVKNQGTGTSSQPAVAFYLSSNSTSAITSGDIQLATTNGTGQQIAPGATLDSVVKFFSIPPTIADGIYYLKAIADYTDSVAESNESNNIFVGNTIQKGKPDLTMASLSAPSTWAWGQAITISSTVRDLMTNDACNFSVGFYLSGSTGDIFLTSRSLPLLSGSQSDSTPLSYTVPTSGIIPVGTYQIKATADYLNAVSETVEVNNTISGNTITIVAPDLMVLNTGVSSTYNAGSTITFTNTVGNQGGAAAPASVLGWYLNTTGDTSSNLISPKPTRAVPSLAAGTQSSGVTQLTIPEWLTTGTYYFTAYADDNHGVAESNESNNTKSTQVIINAVVDLYLRGYYDGSVNFVMMPGCTYYPEMYIANLGAKAPTGQFTVTAQYYFSPPAAPLTALGFVPHDPSLVAGPYYHAAYLTPITVPTNATLGNDTVVFTVDSTNTSGDINRGNNVFTASVDVVAKSGACP